jgi:hypothetical protein
MSAGKLRISQLRIDAANRPPGYLAEVFAHGRAEGDVLHIEHAAYLALVQKYSPAKSVSLMRKSRNLAGAGGRVVKAAVKREKIKVSAEEQQRRLAICEGVPSVSPRCEHFTRSINFGAISCSRCSCALNLKTRLATESCPIGKW